MLKYDQIKELGLKKGMKISFTINKSGSEKFEGTIKSIKTKHSYSKSDNGVPYYEISFTNVIRNGVPSKWDILENQFYTIEIAEITEPEIKENHYLIKYFEGKNSSELTYLYNKKELMEVAVILNIKDRSKMNKFQLAMSIEDHLTGQDFKKPYYKMMKNEL